MVIRFYLALKWLGWNVLRPLPLKDRWGFNLGDDLHEWTTLRMFIYLRKLEKLAGFEPVEVAHGPRFRITENTLGATFTSGTSTTWTGFHTF